MNMPKQENQTALLKKNYNLILKLRNQRRTPNFPPSEPTTRNSLDNLCCGCGGEIDRDKRPWARYCSDSCNKKDYERRKRENNGKKPPRICDICGSPLPDGSPSNRRYCSTVCVKKGQLLVARRTRKKIENRFNSFKASFGCLLCGYDSFGEALDFHHICPEEKNFGIGYHVWHYYPDASIKEMKKCLLVCRNCHALIHRGVVEVNDDILESLGYTTGGTAYE